MIRRLSLLAALTLLLSSCGFALRGEMELPPVMQNTYVAYGGQDANTLRAVVRALTMSGVDIARHPENATAILKLPLASVSSRVLARDSRGQPREYELAVIFGYTVVDADGETVVPYQQVEQFGNVTLNPSEPLANAGEVQRAAETLREQAIWEMLARIAATAREPVAEGIEDAEPGE